MNNPYPTALQLRAEAAAGKLLAEQEAATGAFLAIVRTAQAAVAALHFPLGTPAYHYDLDEITGALADWQKGRTVEDLEVTAEDLLFARIDGPPPPT